MRALSFLITVLSINLICCNSQLYQAEELPKHQIIYGNGGGFTGEVKTYILLENGQRFTSNYLTKINEEYSSISKKKAKSIFKAVAELKLEKVELNNPGNTYTFLGIQTDSSLHQVTWGNPNFTIPDEIQKIYNDLTELK